MSSQPHETIPETLTFYQFSQVGPSQTSLKSDHLFQQIVNPNTETQIQTDHTQYTDQGKSDVGVKLDERMSSFSNTRNKHCVYYNDTLLHIYMEPPSGYQYFVNGVEVQHNDDVLNATLWELKDSRIIYTHAEHKNMVSNHFRFIMSYDFVVLSSGDMLKTTIESQLKRICQCCSGTYTEAVSVTIFANLNEADKLSDVTASQLQKYPLAVHLANCFEPISQIHKIKFRDRHPISTYGVFEKLSGSNHNDEMKLVAKVLSLNFACIKNLPMTTQIIQFNTVSQSLFCMSGYEDAVISALPEYHQLVVLTGAQFHPLPPIGDHPRVFKERQQDQEDNDHFINFINYDV